MTRPGSGDGGFVGLLRAGALIAVLLGAAGSIGLMLRAGRRNPSFLLTVLFTIWVLSPFVALGLATIASRRWSGPTRATLCGLALVLTAGSLAFYSGVLSGPAGSRPAFVFLVVPLVSWLLMAIVVPTAAFVSARRSR